jgi:hypothetical protein
MDEGDRRLEEILAGDTFDNILGDSGRARQSSKAILGGDVADARLAWPKGGRVMARTTGKSGVKELARVARWRAACRRLLAAPLQMFLCAQR